MGIGFDHFGKIVRGAGEREIMLSSKGAGRLSTMEGLFIANRQQEVNKLCSHKVKEYSQRKFAVEVIIDIHLNFFGICECKGFSPG